MRRASGALVGDGGGTGGLGGAASCVATLTWNDTTSIAGATPHAFASVRSTPGPAAKATGPARQQLPQLCTRRASDEASGDAFAAIAVGWFAAGVLW